MEIMPVTGTIRDCIKDKSRLDEINDLIEEGKDHYGSQTFDQHLMDLVNSGAVEFEVAKSAANNPADFDLKMNMFKDPRSSKGGGHDLKEEMSNMYGGGR
jgi:twitching motility protein PilT